MFLLLLKLMQAEMMEANPESTCVQNPPRRELPGFPLWRGPLGSSVAAMQNFQTSFTATSMSLSNTYLSYLVLCRNPGPTPQFPPSQQVPPTPTSPPLSQPSPCSSQSCPQISYPDSNLNSLKRIQVDLPFHGADFPPPRCHLMLRV